MPIRLFTQGTHKGLTYTAEDIKNIFNKTIEKGKEMLPFVLGHPQNDLPILGFVGKDKLQLYTEGDNLSVGFEKGDAEFSDESMQVLKSKKANKISVRLREGYIRHIGLVDNPAVKENRDQDFADNMNGDFCGADDFSLLNAPKEDLEKSSFLERLLKIEKILFKPNLKTEKKGTPMEAQGQDFSVEKQALQAEVEKHKQEAERLKKENEQFAEAKKTEAKAKLQEKIKALKMDEATAKSTTDFGEKLLAKDNVLFEQWLGNLQSVKPSVQVINGSVANGDFADDGKKESATENLNKQFLQIKKQ